jgi:hypothetical protein
MTHLQDRGFIHPFPLRSLLLLLLLMPHSPHTTLRSQKLHRGVIP